MQPSIQSAGSADLGPLFNPPKEPPPLAMKAIDRLSFALPILAAGLAVWGGVEALRKVDDWAALLGIAGGIAGAGGVLFTGWASRIRDGRLAVAQSLGASAMGVADWTLSQAPPHF
jgi:hypothetical protein